MKTTAIRRSANLAGLFLLSLIVLALSLEIAPAMVAGGAGVGGGTDETVGPSVPPADTAAALLRHTALDKVAALNAPAASSQTAASGISTTTWVIIAVVVAMLAIAAWLLVRRRSRPETGPSRGAAFCTLHPEDARCGAA